MRIDLQCRLLLALDVGTRHFTVWIEPLPLIAFVELANLGRSDDLEFSMPDGNVVQLGLVEGPDPATYIVKDAEGDSIRGMGILAHTATNGLALGVTCSMTLPGAKASRFSSSWKPIP